MSKYNRMIDNINFVSKFDMTLESSAKQSELRKFVYESHVNEIKLKTLRTNILSYFKLQPEGLRAKMLKDEIIKSCNEKEVNK